MFTSYREILSEREKPIRVGIVGAGEFSEGIVSQLALMRGIEPSAIADTNPDKAVSLFCEAGFDETDIIFADSAAEGNRAIEAGKKVVLQDGMLLPELEVDAVCDVTGDPPFGAALAKKSIGQHRHTIVINIESDVAVGAILRRMAEREGVVYTEGDGDQPSLIRGLYEWCETLAIPVYAAGKWTHITPEEKWNLEGKRSDIGFRDGSKNQVEMCCVANMTGLVPDKQGMHMPSLTLEEVLSGFAPREQGGLFSRSGIVDVVNCLSEDGKSEKERLLGGGVFVVAEPTTEAARQAIRYKGFLSSADGRRALLYRPYHFVGVETPISIIRAVIDGFATGAPLPTPVADVCAIAKKDLIPGERLDGIGGGTVRGEIICADEARNAGYLPLALAQDVRVKQAVRKGTTLTYDMLESRSDSEIWHLRTLQDEICR